MSSPRSCRPPPARSARAPAHSARLWAQSCCLARKNQNTQKPQNGSLGFTRREVPQHRAAAAGSYWELLGAGRGGEPVAGRTHEKKRDVDVPVERCWSEELCRCRNPQITRGGKPSPSPAPSPAPAPLGPSRLRLRARMASRGSAAPLLPQPELETHRPLARFVSPPPRLHRRLHSFTRPGPTKAAAGLHSGAPRPLEAPRSHRRAQQRRARILCPKRVQALDGLTTRGPPARYRPPPHPQTRDPEGSAWGPPGPEPQYEGTDNSSKVSERKKRHKAATKRWKTTTERHTTPRNRWQINTKRQHEVKYTQYDNKETTNNHKQTHNSHKQMKNDHKKTTWAWMDTQWQCRDQNKQHRDK